MGSAASSAAVLRPPEAVITAALRNVAEGLPVEQGLNAADHAALQAFAGSLVASSDGANGHAYGDEHHDAARKVQAAQRKKQGVQRMAVEANGENLRAVFHAFAQYGHRNETVSEMEGKNFAKMCKECKLVGKKYTSTDCDLTFAKYVTKGQKKLTFQQWEAALAHVAARLGVEVEAVHKKLVVHGVPQSSGTKAEYSKFYDDKSTWGGGVWEHGGPSTVDSKPTLESQANRDNKADIRGVVR